MIPTGGCALASRRGGEDPVASAAWLDQLFLLQIPRPWERNALDTAAAPAGVQRALAGAARAKRRARALLIDGGPPLAPGMVRLLSYRKPGGLISSYVAREYLVPHGNAAALIERLGVRALAGEDPEGVDVRALGAERAPDPVRDLFICTHGERDDCCGTFGEAAYRRACRLDLAPGTRVWRLSHLGGHRFAPTVLDLPTGRAFGRLDEATLAAVAHRVGRVEDLRATYRGWCALPSAAQFLERELFAAHGWGWLEARVKATVATAPDGHRVRLDARLPDGSAIAADARIVERDPVVLPLSCGADESVVPQYAFARPPVVAPAVPDRTDPPRE